MTKKSPKKRQKELLAHYGRHVDHLEAPLLSAFHKITAERCGYAALTPRLDIRYGVRDDDGVYQSWGVNVGLGDREVVIWDRRSTWLGTQAARIAILEAFDNLCTQYLEQAQ